MSPHSAGVLAVDLDGQRVEIGYTSKPPARGIVRFLFVDLKAAPTELPALARFDVVASSPLARAQSLEWGKAALFRPGDTSGGRPLCS